MAKLKYIFLLVVFASIIYSCGDENFVNNPFADIDHEALALSDNDSIISFLNNYYYDTSLDSLKTLSSGKTSLLNDSNLEEFEVTENDIKYKLYIYSIREGSPSPDPEKGNPTTTDSVFVKYSGRAFNGTSLSTVNFDQNTTGTWFNLIAVIKGWTYGFTKFKGGALRKNADGTPFNGPVTYLNGGKGFIFIPSGLGYPSSNTQNYSNSLVDTNLLFKIELLNFVKDTDHDNDGVPTIVEDLDGDDNPNNDDTDEDGIPNYFDTDDDEDGVLTIKEDKNKDGNPANDFSDSTQPDLPDYLNPVIK